MQRKTTMRSHLTPVRMPEIGKQMLVRMWGRSYSNPLLMGIYTSATIKEDGMFILEIPEKLK